jgi:gliding motility-associated-like protein
MRTALVIVFLLVAFASVAQVPVVQKVEPLTTFPGDTIVISGNGFNPTSSNNQVWFEGVMGTVISATEYSIVVVVPFEAKYGPVTVVNLGSKLAGRSGLKFTPSMPIEGFDIAKFSTVRTVNGLEEFWDLCYCDFNSDGKQDIATTKFKRNPPAPFPTPTDIMLLQNTSTPGNIDFVKKDKTNNGILNLGFATDNAVCGDLNGDGKVDLVVTRGGQGTRNSIHIFRNTTATVGGDITFAAPTPLFMDPKHFATRMAIRDLNRDGKPEIVCTNAFNDIFYIFLNTSTGGNLTFNTTPVTMSILLEPGEILSTYETDVQDFDGDNLPDIMINQFQTDSFYVFKNQSTGSIDFASPTKFAFEGSFNRLVSADVNGDGLLDPIFTNTIDDNAHVYINKSTPAGFNFGDAPIVLNTSFEPWGVDVADIDGDGDVDIIISNRNRSVPDPANYLLNVFLNDGAATPSFTRADIPTTQQGRNVRVVDLDGDSKPDITYTTFDEATATSQVKVVENSNCFKPRILNTGPVTICAGQTIRLEGIPAQNVTFVWKESGNIVPGSLHYLETNTPGTYTVTAIGEGGACEVTSAAVVVANDPATAPPTPDITEDAPVCVGSQLHLSTTATASSYLWTGPGGQTYTTQSPSFTVDIGDAGIYKLQVTVGVCKSPEAEAVIDVVDLTDFTISSNATADILCQGTTVTLSVNNLSGYAFQWEKNEVMIDGATTSTLTVTQSADYSVSVTPPAGLNCPVIEAGPEEIVFVAPPVSSFSADETACLEEEVTFTNTSTVDPLAIPIYTWNFGDATTSTDQNAVHAYTTAGNVIPSLTVKYDGVTGVACTNSTTKSILVVAAVVPDIQTTAESACPEDEVALSVATGFSSVTWSTADTGETVQVNPGEYNVQTVDANGCASADTIIVIAKEAPTVTVTADPTTIPAGAESQLVSTGGVTYSWSPGSTLSDSLISSPLAKPLVTTLYTVTAASADGCETEAQITITVEGVLGFPVAFSPNGDGQNEIWDIQAQFNPTCMIAIFDGRGRKVFEAMGENWDGTYNGSEAPEGTYYYVYSCPDAKPKTGSILLFR